jgi:hypothetical protein
VTSHAPRLPFAKKLGAAVLIEIVASAVAASRGPA